jgi:hypothetical protein
MVYFIFILGNVIEIMFLIHLIIVLNHLFLIVISYFVHITIYFKTLNIGTFFLYYFLNLNDLNLLIYFHLDIMNNQNYNLYFQNYFIIHYKLMYKYAPFINYFILLINILLL